MKIYQITRVDHIDWDEAVAFVVIAESPNAAIELAASRPGIEGSDFWRTSPNVRCTRIGTTEIITERIVLRS